MRVLIMNEYGKAWLVEGDDAVLALKILSDAKVVKIEGYGNTRTITPSKMEYPGFEINVYLAYIGNWEKERLKN